MQKIQRLQLPLAGTALLLCLLIGVYLLAWKRSSKRADKTSVAKHKVEKSADETLKYWTAEKMRNASPVPLPTTTDINEQKKQ